MRSINQQIKIIKDQNRLGLMTHVVIGYPTLKKSEEIILSMAQSGVDMIELQIPFSDPLADGPVIMKACEESLRGGTTLADCFEMMKKLSDKVNIPLLFMAYYNTVFSYGPEKFIALAKKIGCQGLIIPDIPLEEEAHEHFFLLCKKYDIVPIKILSLTSTPKRIKKNLAHANGFVYYMSRLGTTGSQTTLDPHLDQNLKNLKKLTKLPIAVGFGISKPSHIKALKGRADMAIIGSAIVGIINSSPKYLKEIKRFIKTIKQAAS